jgi:hypothetical protein
MRRITWLAGGLLVLFAAPVVGQEPKGVEPGPEHAKFKKLVGTWDATIAMQGNEAKGTMTWHLGLGNLWLLEHFKADLGDMKFEGMGATTYDPAKKQYVSVWLDSMSTTPMITHGNYKGDKMVMKGKMNQGGKMMNVTMTSVMKDNNNIVFTMTTDGPDGNAMEMMKISYKRRQKAQTE